MNTWCKKHCGEYHEIRDGEGDASIPGGWHSFTEPYCREDRDFEKWCPHRDGKDFDHSFYQDLFTEIKGLSGKSMYDKLDTMDYYEVLDLLDDESFSEDFFKYKEIWEAPDDED